MTRKCGSYHTFNQRFRSGQSLRQIVLPGKNVSKIMFSLGLLFTACAQNVHAQACALIPNGGGQGISPTITNQSTGAELANGAVVPSGTSLRFDAIANAYGSCSQVGPGCFGDAERTINHINVQSDISTGGALNGHYVEGYVFGWDENHITAYYHVLDTHSSSSTGPLITTLFEPGKYEYHFWAVINTTPCEIAPDQTETVTITIYVGDVSAANFGPSPSPCPKTSVGEPINVTNGNMYLQQTDYRLPGLGEGLDLTRTYNSQSTRTGIFGYGWTTPYEESLQLLGNSFIKLNLGDGRAVFLAKRTTGEFTPQVPVDFRGQIVNNTDGTYTLTFKDGGVHQFNSSGKLLSLSDRNNNTITLSYDSNGRLTTVTDASSRTLTFAYASNIVSSVSDSQGTIATYTSWWDRLETVRYPDGSGFNFYHNWSYNKLGIVTDVYGNYLESHTYDDAGHALTSQVANNGTELYTLNYVSAMETDVTDALGHVTKYFYDTGKGRNAVTRVEGSCGCGSSQINAVNNITQMIDSAGTQSFTYDSVDRLTSATHTGQANESYSYDAVGNRTASHLSSSYTYQPFNRLASTSAATLSYDNNGNLLTKTEGIQTTQYVWDSENRLTQVSRLGSPDVWYKYDALGRRIERDKGVASPIPLATETTRFVYDGPDVLRDLDGAGTSVADYLNAPGIDNKLRQTVSGTASYFIQDHLGTTRGFADASGNGTSSLSYDAFDNVTNGSPLTRYTYTGRESDSDTGVMHYRARPYNSQVGRFIGEDPVGFDGGINFYGYVGNNPLNSRDPLGLLPDNPYELIPESGREIVAQIGNFAAGFGDALTTIPFSNISVTRQIRIWQGIDQFVDRCSPAYSDGGWAAVALEIGVGAKIGASSLRQPPKWSGKEWSHWIPNRARWVPSGIRNSSLNGNYTTIADHALNDPFRYKWMPKTWKDANQINPVLLRQWNRVPNWVKGGAAGAGLAVSQRPSTDCDCR